MAKGECSVSECTVAQTGICLNENDPNECPNRALLEVVEAPQDSLEPPLKEPQAAARFPSSLTLGPGEARELMASRYCHLVGILGLPKSGKTAALVSTYLLLSRSKLNGFEFRDSRSLRSFDEISHGARVWKEGQPFEQMTVHTELADARTPGFMHLRLHQTVGGRVLDFLLPDLPGEWSTDLIDYDRSDRFEFLQAADVLWVVVDGEELKNARHLTVHRTELLLQRLAVFLKRRPKLTFVITRRDHGPPEESAVKALEKEGERLGFEVSIAEIASFKDGSHLSPGFGIAELLSSAADVATVVPEFWPGTPRTGPRAMLNFRKAGE